MEEALLARLLAAPSLAATFADRIDWWERPRRNDDAPGDLLPAVTLTKVTPGRAYTHDGPDGLDAPRVQADVWSETKLGAVQGARALRDVLEQTGSAAGWWFGPAWVEGEFQAIDDDAGSPLFRVTTDYSFHTQMMG